MAMKQRHRNSQSFLEEWVAVNSGSNNLKGLQEMAVLLKEAFNPLSSDISIIDLPPRKSCSDTGVISSKPVGQALHVRMRHNTTPRVLLVGHMDTVFPENTDFRAASRIDFNTMQGPGSADMKGGIAIMVEALYRLEESPYAKRIGWDVIITPDEELGSPSSKDLLKKMAQKAAIGLVFEPSLPDGTLVSARKGSAVLLVIAKGKAAHAGRDHHLGKNAITALATFIAEAQKLHQPDDGIILNFGHIQGGESPNIVPDLAITRLNIRAYEKLDETISQIEKFAKNGIEGIVFEIHKLTYRPPKFFDKKTEKLFLEVRKCGKELGIDINWQPSGGVCDGNFLAEAGLPTIDTMGAIGGNIHTTEEYVKLDSLEMRSALAASLLIKFAKGEIQL